MMPDRLRRRFVVIHRRYPLAPWLVLGTVFLLQACRDERDVAVCLLFAPGSLLAAQVKPPRRGWVRRLAVAVVAGGSILFFFIHRYEPEVAILGGMNALVVAGVSLAGWAIRKWGVHLGLRNSDRRMQFSIRGMLTVTTLVAILAGLIRLFGDDIATFGLFLVWSVIPLAAVRWNRQQESWRSVLGRVMGLAFGIACLVGIFFEDDLFPGTLLQGVFYTAWLLGLRVRMGDIAPRRRATSLPEGRL